MAHILIVDDQANVRTAVVQLLLSCNRPDLHIDQVSNGDEALRRMQARRYDLLISDTEMPGMNVTDMMHAVRADEKLKSLPTILMLAVGAGLVSIASPCVLPVLPIVMAGRPGEHRLRPLAIVSGLMALQST